MFSQKKRTLENNLQVVVFYFFAHCPSANLGCLDIILDKQFSPGGALLPWTRTSPLDSHFSPGRALLNPKHVFLLFALIFSGCVLWYRLCAIVRSCNCILPSCGVLPPHLFLHIAIVFFHTLVFLRVCFCGKFASWRCVCEVGDGGVTLLCSSANT